MNGSGKSELEATRQTIKFFETLLRASADGIVITDTAQNIVLVNEAFCAFFGQRWQDVVETSLFVWLEQLDGDGLQRWAELEQCVRREGVCRDAEFQLTTRKGVKHLNVNCALLEQVADEESGIIISIWHDVTGRVRAEKALQKAHDELEMRVVERTVELGKANKELHAEIAERMRAEKKLAASNEELEDFAYVVSHDLKA
ncbi:MAG: PAS domain S-box protein, partial [Chloroflexi bacterium]|nr:PAS domain S-box protein [Chloroflexota bacterium]